MASGIQHSLGPNERGASLIPLFFSFIGMLKIHQMKEKAFELSCIYLPVGLNRCLFCLSVICSHGYGAVLLSVGGISLTETCSDHSHRKFSPVAAQAEEGLTIFENFRSCGCPWLSKKLRIKLLASDCLLVVLYTSHGSN